MRSLFLGCFALCIACASRAGQVEARLFSRADSLPLSFAAVRDLASGTGTTTDEAGFFRFEIPGTPDSVQVEIVRVGCRAVLRLPVNPTRLISMYIDCAPLGIREVSIRGMSAEAVVREAVARIPVRTPAYPFVTTGRALRYRKIEGRVTGRTELGMLALYRAVDDHGGAADRPAIAVWAVRDSGRDDDVPVTRVERVEALLAADPVFCLSTGMLAPRAFPEYRFDFLKDQDGDTLFIRYVCELLENEPHGIENYKEAGLREEGWEIGLLKILQSDFSICSIRRDAVRRNSYQYPRFNNFVLPERKFTQEFEGATFYAEYARHGDAWFTKRLAYRYTNTFYHVMTHQHAYTITDCQEWLADSLATTIRPDLADRFYFSESEARAAADGKLQPMPEEDPVFYFE